MSHSPEIMSALVHAESAHATYLATPAGYLGTSVALDRKRVARDAAEDAARALRDIVAAEVPADRGWREIEAREAVEIRIAAVLALL